MRVRVDKGLCIGDETCVEISPEVGRRASRTGGGMHGGIGVLPRRGHYHRGINPFVISGAILNLLDIC